MQVIRSPELEMIYNSLEVAVGLGICCMVEKTAARCSSRHDASDRTCITCAVSG